MIINPYRYAVAGYGNDFVLEMATTGSAETVTIPCQNVGSFSANIDWGDGTADSTITTYNDGDLAHQYADAGDHIIRISGTFPNIYFANAGDKLKLKKIYNWGDTGLTILSNAFFGCTNLTSITSTVANTSSVTDMSGLFRNCSGLTEADLSGWDMLGVNNTSLMFYNAPNLTTIGDVSGWDTSTITNMSNMFFNCDSLTDVPIDGWNIEAVTNFTGFMTNHIGLLTSRYDAVLIAWDAQNPTNSLTVDFGGSTYTGGGAAATARASLESGDLWTITDGGIA